MDRVQISYQLVVSEPAERGLKRRPSSPSRSNPSECRGMLGSAVWSLASYS